MSLFFHFPHETIIGNSGFICQNHIRSPWRNRLIRQQFKYLLKPKELEMISTYLEVIAVSLREIAETSRKVTNLRARSCPETTVSPSSKYEHQRVSALLRNIQNIRICKRKKPILSVTYENERISIKKAYLT